MSIRYRVTGTGMRLMDSWELFMTILPVIVLLWRNLFYEIWIRCFILDLLYDNGVIDSCITIELETMNLLLCNNEHINTVGHLRDTKCIITRIF